MLTSEINQLIELSLSGNKEDLEKLLVDINDLVFKLLRFTTVEESTVISRI